MDQPSEEVIARQRANLEQFVLRARRIEAHSLAADWDALVSLASDPHKLRISEDGQTRIRYEFPPEEVVESAAARVRPLLLETDACGYLKSLKALTYLCRSEPRDKAWLKAARAEWKARTQEGALGYRVLVGDIVTGDTADMADQELAMAWIYGDVVHHDTERRQEADPFGLSARFRAAVPLVAWVMVAAIELLTFLRFLQGEGELALRPEVLDTEVILESTQWEYPVQIRTAPVGTAPPADALAPYSEAWTPWSGTGLVVPVKPAEEPEPRER
ncbi:hypothetical protein [Streptomyces sp. NRRL S-813]|uniref:hypothetical protein n=1 Tax=Streptomyces sp. NRRL S-813 TaxID=1463919 RepID=UPI00068E8567|nr:hypothetical protein [Streptomyces sp. NRRL S-813]